ncbi:DAGAT-domain-containing protein [Xylariaceae sp. FL0594]|nr:DAGAT-domain-containing protein [Xylariaceae sp. FL0594]
MSSQYRPDMSRASKLPRRGTDRPSHLGQPANPDLTPRRSSQSHPAPKPDLRPTRGETTSSYQRDTSSTSFESCDNPASETSLSTPKGASDDGNLLFGGGSSTSRVAETFSSICEASSSSSASHPAAPPSQIPRGPGSKGSAPRLLPRRKVSDKLPKGSNMVNQINSKGGSANITLKRQDSKSPDLDSDLAIPGSKEESFVQVDGMSRGRENQPHNEQKTNGIAEPKPSRVEDDHIRDDVSYASVLKSGLQNGYSRREQDDDDSYPELDDMSMEDVHRPPTRPVVRAGIRWAPWNVPFRRRGQTLVVLLHSLSLVATVSLFFAFCANPLIWPLLLIYLLHVLSSKAATDGLHKSRSERFRRSYIWHFFADYFPARLHKTHDLPSTRKYIFGYHPHGIISHGAWAAFATDALGFSEKFPGIINSLLTLDSNFRIPFYREYVLGMGMQSVSKESIVNNLTRGGLDGEGMGRAVTVVVGGARESLEAQPGMMRLVLKERKGFIKLAIRCGADLVPVLAFGENNLYDQLQPQEHPYMHRIQMFLLKVWKFTLPFLHGRGIFNYDVGLMPYRTPLNVVVGAPIKVRQSSSVDSEEINRLHGLYVAELQKLWDHYKDDFAPDRKGEMEILA